MKSKKIHMLLTAILLLSVLLTACAPQATPEVVSTEEETGQAQPAEEQPAEEMPAEPVKIVFWRALTGAAGDIQDALTQEFNAAQTEVIVDTQFQGTYGELLQKLQAAMIAGDLPDIVQLDSPFVVLFAKNGALTPLDEFAADPTNGVDLTNFIPGFLADGYYNDQLYALPYMRSTPLLYFNKDMFREAGLPDRAPETWDEFKEFCDALTKVENDVPVQQGVSFTMSATTAHWYLQGAIYAYGGLVSDEDFNFYLTQPEAVAAAKLWQDIVFTYKTGKAGIDEGGPHGDLLNHRVGMAFGSTGSMANLISNADFELGAGLIPMQTKREVPVGGSVISMTSKDPQRQLAAWKFMKFLTQPSSNSQIVIQTGYLPTSQATIEHPDIVEYYGQYPERAIALEQLKYARPQASIISLATGTEIMRQLVEQLLVGNVPVEEAMQTAEDALKTEYEENFK